MPETIVLIDTNIWHFGYIKPKEPEFLVIHEKARDFLLQVLEDKSLRIGLTVYQLGEIVDILRRIIKNIIRDFRSNKFWVKELTLSDVNISISKSLESDIHIDDYFVAISLHGLVSKIYSADDHFLHPDFTEIAPVENPLAPRILKEGKRPERGTK